jgi:NADH-quinone oxidoreductase subunit K
MLYINNDLLLDLATRTLWGGFYAISGFFLSVGAVAGLILNKNNLINILIFFELLLLFINFNFLSFALILDNAFGLTVALYIIMIAGAEVSLGLAFVILIFRIKGVLNLNFLLSLKG